MTDPSIWSDVAIGYSPFIDRHRNVVGTRLTVFSKGTAFPAPDAGQLLEGLADAWPTGAPRLSLNVMSEGMLVDLLHGRAQEGLMIEVPAFMAADAAHAQAIARQSARGMNLLLKGRPASGLPAALTTCFQSFIIDLQDDRRLNGEAAKVAASCIYSGVSSIADMDASFARGAGGVFGWPIDEAVSPGSKSGKAVTPPDLQVITELMNRVDRQEPIEKLEECLRRDPALAYKLLRFINSPVFGLRVEIASFKHAIMMLGHQRLKRWLALLLATASKDANQRPLMFAAVRRGLLMEDLAKASGDDEMRNELFICGVFSLLDRMFKQPFGELLSTIPVPDRVHDALVKANGPYQPFLDLVHAIEGESMFDMDAACETLMLDSAEVNRALLRALAAATQLE